MDPVTGQELAHPPVHLASLDQPQVLPGYSNKSLDQPLVLKPNFHLLLTNPRVLPATRVPWVNLSSSSVSCAQETFSLWQVFLFKFHQDRFKMQAGCQGWGRGAVLLHQAWGAPFNSRSPAKESLRVLFIGAIIFFFGVWLFFPPHNHMVDLTQELGLLGLHLLLHLPCGPP